MASTNYDYIFKVGVETESIAQKIKEDIASAQAIANQNNLILKFTGDQKSMQDILKQIKGLDPTAKITFESDQKNIKQLLSGLDQSLQKNITIDPNQTELKAAFKSLGDMAEKQLKGVNLTSYFRELADGFVDSTKSSEQLFTMIQNTKIELEALASFSNKFSLKFLNESKLQDLVKLIKDLGQAQKEYEDQQRKARLEQGNYGLTKDQIAQAIKTKRYPEKLGKDFAKQVMSDQAYSDNKTLIDQYGQTAELLDYLIGKKKEFSEITTANDAQEYLKQSKQIYDVYQRLSSLQQQVIKKTGISKTNDNLLLEKYNGTDISNTLNDAMQEYVNQQTRKYQTTINQTTNRINDFLIRNIQKVSQQVEVASQNTAAKIERQNSRLRSSSGVTGVVGGGNQEELVSGLEDAGAAEQNLGSAASETGEVILRSTEQASSAITDLKNQIRDAEAELENLKQGIKTQDAFSNDNKKNTVLSLINELKQLEHDFNSGDITKNKAQRFLDISETLRNSLTGSEYDLYFKGLDGLIERYDDLLERFDPGAVGDFGGNVLKKIVNQEAIDAQIQKIEELKRQLHDLTLSGDGANNHNLGDTSIVVHPDTSKFMDEVKEQLKGSSIEIDVSASQNSLNALSQKLHEISQKSINYNDVPLLSDASGLVIDTYRGVHGAFGLSGKEGISWFTDELDLAAQYADSLAEDGKIIKANLAFKNPLEIFGNNADFDKIDITSYRNVANMATSLGFNPNKMLTDDIVRVASNLGYDGVIFRDIKDGYDALAHNVFAVIDQMQVKNEELYGSMKKNTGALERLQSSQQNGDKYNINIQVKTDNIRPEIEKVLAPPFTIKLDHKYNETSSTEKARESIHEVRRPLPNGGEVRTVNTVSSRESSQSINAGTAPGEIEHLDSAISRARSNVQELNEELAHVGLKSPSQQFDNEIQQNVVMLENYKNTIAEIDRLKLEPETEEAKAKIEELNTLADYFASKITAIRGESGAIDGTFMMDPATGRFSTRLQSIYTDDQLNQMKTIARDRYGLSYHMDVPQFTKIGDELESIESKSALLHESLANDVVNSSNYVAQLKRDLVDLIDTKEELSHESPTSKWFGLFQNDIEKMSARSPEILPLLDSLETMNQAIDFTHSDGWNDFLATLPKAHRYLESIGYDFERIKPNSDIIVSASNEGSGHVGNGSSHVEASAEAHERAAEAAQHHAEEAKKAAEAESEQPSEPSTSNTEKQIEANQAEAESAREAAQAEQEKQDVIASQSSPASNQANAVQQGAGQVIQSLTDEEAVLDRFKDKLQTEIPNAVDTKTQAFRSEQVEVDNLVSLEESSLQRLVDALQRVADKATEINAALGQTGKDNNFSSFLSNIKENEQALIAFAEVLKKTNEEQAKVVDKAKILNAKVVNENPVDPSQWKTVLAGYDELVQKLGGVFDIVEETRRDEKTQNRYISYHLKGPQGTAIVGKNNQILDVRSQYSDDYTQELQRQKERADIIKQAYGEIIKSIDNYKQAATDLNNFEAQSSKSGTIDLERRKEVYAKMEEAAQKAADSVKMAFALTDMGDITPKQMADVQSKYNQAKFGSEKSQRDREVAARNAAYKEQIDIIEQATSTMNKYNDALTKDIKGESVFGVEARTGMSEEINRTSEAADIAIGKIRELGEQGKITAEQLASAEMKYRESWTGSDSSIKSMQNAINQRNTQQEKSWAEMEKQQIQEATKAIDNYYKTANKGRELQIQSTIGQSAKAGGQLNDQITAMNDLKTSAEGYLNTLKQLNASGNTTVSNDFLKQYEDKIAAANEVQQNLLTDSGKVGFENTEKQFETLIQYAQRYYDILHKPEESRTYADKNFLLDYGKYYEDAIKQAEQFAKSSDEAQKKMGESFLKSMDNADVESYKNILNGVGQEIDKLQQKQWTKTGSEGLKAMADQYDALYKKLQQFSKLSPDELSKFKEELANILKMQGDFSSGKYTPANPTSATKLSANMSNFMANNSAASTYFPQIRALQDALKSPDLNGQQLSEIASRFNQIRQAAADAGKMGRSFGDALKKSFSGLTRYMATYVSFYRIIGAIKSAIATVKEFDTALMEVRKVSTETLSTLQQWQKTTFDMANSVGGSAIQIQKSTASWLRLGKDFQEAQKAAQASTKLLNVSEFTNIDDATKSLVSISQAYKDLTYDDVIDKLNNVGDHFSSSTDQLAQGLQNAAAVLKTQGNSIDEALALLTAGNDITQDISKTSAGIRTIALRISGKSMPEHTVMYGCV